MRTHWELSQQMLRQFAILVTAYGKITSQLQMTVEPKPSIVMNLKLRWDTLAMRGTARSGNTYS